MKASGKKQKLNKIKIKNEIKENLYIQDRERRILNTKPNATIEILYEGDWEEIETQ